MTRERRVGPIILPDEQTVTPELIIDKLIRARRVLDRPSIDVIGNRRAEQKREAALNSFNRYIEKIYENELDLEFILREVDQKLHP